MITILKKEDGFWLRFQSNINREALVSVDKIINSSGPIVKSAVLACCIESVANNENGATASTNKLKAEIAALVETLAPVYGRTSMQNGILAKARNRLRQLSAV